MRRNERNYIDSVAYTGWVFSLNGILIVVEDAGTSKRNERILSYAPQVLVLSGADGCQVCGD
jgi:hypothetical protein